MAEKLSAAVFAKFVKERAQAKDGYIMGSRGQDPKKWAKNSWWFTQYKGNQKTKALYWRENAQRVWDCQGLAEGYINQETGSNIDVRARNNYSSWCDPKGKGKVPEQYRMPGTAVFIGSPATHVGYLIEPVEAGNPAGDWIVGEARGVMYGVVLTKLNSRGWTHWGLMTKYFAYDGYEDKPLELGDRTLSKGMSGADVRELQSMLIGLGYDLGKWGADGDFGSDTQSAVKKFQQDYRLDVDGAAGPDTLEALKNAYTHQDAPETGDTQDPVEEGTADGTLAEVGDIDEKEEPLEGDGRVVLVSSGNTVNVRDQPNTEGKILGVARKGESFSYRGETSPEGWHGIVFQDAAGWISGKYTTLAERGADAPKQEFLVDFLDLSSHNSYQETKIDWENLAATVGFLVLRCGCNRKNTKPKGIGGDAYFAKWAQKCKQHGIPFWAYFFSKAETEEEARAEARFTAETAAPYGPVGLCLDAEVGTLNQQLILAWFDELGKYWQGKTMIYQANHRRKKYNLPKDADGFVACCGAVWIPFYVKNDGELHFDKVPGCSCDAVQGTSKYRHKAVPDKSLDASFITGQRRTLAWFRGEE